VTVHCFEEFIGERAFVIEVTDAGNRWRAQLRRRPGVPTAMMPFYGASPAEAAHRLMDWMRRAHERQLAVARHGLTGETLVRLKPEARYW
jgi:hypothetical protein